MKLLIAGSEDATPTVAFRIEQNGNDVDVYANDIFIGWFQTNADHKVEFRSGCISAENRGTFAVDANYKLLAR